MSESLERRWEHLRVHHPQHQRRLLASLADSGQQVPIVVVVAKGSRTAVSYRVTIHSVTSAGSMS